MSEFSHVLGSNPQTGAIPQVVVDWLAENLPDSGTSGSGILNVSGTVNLDDAPGIREVYATASATVEGVALAAGDAAVFRYFAGAWTYMIVGEHTTWQSISATPVTANVPTADDTANTITWTPKTGVQYVIGGSVRTPPYSVGDVTASVTVTAQATAGYTLTGTSSWTFNFTGSAPADTTPPNPGTLAVTGTGDAGTTRTLTVTGASDAGGLHAQPYRFSTDGGTTWSAYQSSNAFTTGALAAGTYQPRVMVRDAAGNTATASTADFTVNAAGAAAPDYAETFTRPDGTNINGLTTETGGTAFVTNSSAWASEVLTPTSTTMTIQSGKVATAGPAIIEPRPNTVVDHRHSLDYDVSAAAGCEVRLSFNTGMDCLIIKGDGRLLRDSVGGTAVATGLPTTGNVEVTRTGASVTVKVDGSTVYTGSGAPNPPMARTRVGFGISGTPGATVDNFKVWIL